MQLNKIDWKLVSYLRQGESLNYDYKLWLNEPLASWDVYDYWERCRAESMRSNLTQDDILFDIGAEQGWLSLVYATMAKIVLIEPTPEFWANIRALWKKNRKDMPLATVKGLISNKNKDEVNFSIGDFVDYGDKLIDKNSYKYIHQNTEAEITLDLLIEKLGIAPTAITIDTEGSEFLILQGATKMLQKGIKVWVSIHDDLAEKDYGVKPNDVIEFLVNLGYKSTFLGEDHEKHYMFTK